MLRMNRRTLLAGVSAALVTRSFAEQIHGAFGAKSTAEEVTQGLDLRGKTAVVTGCNSGLGLESMRVLAMRGAHVIGTARTLEKGREACAQMKGHTTPVVLELADFPSVVECAKKVRALTSQIDILMLNAGIVLEKLEQVGGLEKQFVVNHLGHFILAHRVLDLVHSSKQGRVVTVGSGSHTSVPPGGIQFDNLSGAGWFHKGYGHSKLANGLFSLELSRRFAGTRATSNCLTPGPVDTKIRRNMAAPPAREEKTVQQGAATQCYLATNPMLAKTTGEYFKDCNPAPQSDFQRDTAMAEKLWALSTQLTQKYLG